MTDIVGPHALQNRDLAGFCIHCHFDSVTAVREIGEDRTLSRLFVYRIGEVGGKELNCDTFLLTFPNHLVSS